MITITEASIEDIAKIQEIAKITWPITYGEILTKEQLDYMLDLIYSDEALSKQIQNKEQLFYLISDSESVIGFIGIEHNYKNEAITKIHKIYLLPETQGKGFGKFMIDEIENFDESQQIYIYDNISETYHNIKSETFQITLPEGVFNERFSLRFTNGENLGIENPAFFDGIHVSFTSNNNVLHIKNQSAVTTVIATTVFNLLGQKIASYDVENQTQNAIQIPVSNISTGTYIVKIKTSNGDLSKKILVK